MSRTEIDRSVLPSLLDRLTDDAPGTPADPAITREESARRFRASVLRDLDWLLNTRRRSRIADESEIVRRSTFGYGLPDFSDRTTSSLDWQERLLEDVRETVRWFEPRLANVDVRLAGETDPSLRQLRFVVTATLLMDPRPEQIVFDTVLEVANGDFAVEDRT